MDKVIKPLDGKFQIEYDERSGIQIVNAASGEAIPEDEPKFLLRGRDTLSFLLLLRYYSLCEEEGCTPHHMKGVSRASEEFAQFRRNNPGRMKQPGSTEGKQS
jgi:hypothetical protein